jgi:uncharacterized protein
LYLKYRDNINKQKGLNEYMKKVNEMKTCIIVHGCPSDSKDKTYDKHWMPWLKEELNKRGIKTEISVMPKPWHPNYNNFKKEFENYKVNENAVLIGHSCGCAFLVRWLGETKQKVDKLILVAPWKIPDKDDKYRKEFYEYSIDKTITERVNQIVMFTADDEEDDGKKSLKLFHKALGGKIIELKKHGHYTIGAMGTEEFPELFEEIVKR